MKETKITSQILYSGTIKVSTTNKYKFGFTGFKPTSCIDTNPRTPRIGDTAMLRKQPDNLDIIVDTIVDMDGVTRYKMEGTGTWFHPNSFEIILTPFEKFVKDIQDEKAAEDRAES